MQIKLTPSELAYLFNMLQADRVVGVDAGRIFPSQPAEREAVLTQGFEQLVADGVLVPREVGYDANNDVVLIAAIMAEPTGVVAATVFVDADARQHMTYYMHQQYIVEQFQAPDGDYVLTRLDAATDLAARIGAAFAGLVTGNVANFSFTLAANAFEDALALAKRDEFARLYALVSLDTRASVTRERVTQVPTLAAIGHVEATAIASRQIASWTEVALMRDSTGVPWLVCRDTERGTITFAAATPPRLAQAVAEVVSQTVNE